MSSRRFASGENLPEDERRGQFRFKRFARLCRFLQRLAFFAASTNGPRGRETPLFSNFGGVLNMLERRVACALLLATCGLLSSGLPRALSADEVQEVVENGIRYRVTTQTRQRVIPETTVVDQEQTIYKEKISNQTKQATRAYSVPVTQWVAEPYVTNPWAVFTPPVMAYRYVPVTHWETRTENYQVQVPNREYEPVKQTLKVPVTKQRLVEERFTSKVAIAPVSSGGPTDLSPSKAVAGGTSGGLDPASANMARRSELGGTRLDSDLRGPGTSSGTGEFRAAEPGRLR